MELVKHNVFVSLVNPQVVSTCKIAQVKLFLANKETTSKCVVN